MPNSKEIFFLLDIYAFNFNLLFKKNETYQTYFGSITGLISIISFILIIILYLIKLLNRGNFNVISYSQRDQNSNITLNNFSIMFALIDLYGNNILNDTKISKLIINYFDNDIRYNINYSSNLCNEYYNYFVYDNSILKDLVECAVFDNISLIGRLGNDNYNFISFSFLICNDDNCYDQKEIEEKLQNIYFFLYIPEYQINHYNYKNPITKTLRAESLTFSINTYKLYDFNFNEVHYNSDDGLIFENHKKNKFLMIESPKVDIMNQNLINFGQIRFSLSLNKIEYFRTYLKIQDALADIGVLIDIIKYIINYITLIFTKQFFDIELVNTIMFPNNINKNYSPKKNNSDNSHMRLGAFNKYSLISNFNSNKYNKYYKYNNKTDIVNRKMFNKLKIKNSNISIPNKIEKPEMTFSTKIKKLKMKWYYYFIFDCCLKQNKQYFILLKCKDKIYECISIDYIFPLIINNKNIFLKQLFKEVDKNDEQLIF